MRLTAKQQKQHYLQVKTDKYEYLTGEEILPTHQSRMIEQATFTYSPLVKAFEKQIQTFENQGEKQVQALKGKERKIKKT